VYAIMLSFLPENTTTLTPRTVVEDTLWAYLGLHSVICLLLAFGMRRFSHDGFHLKAEFRNVGVILLGTVILQVALGGGSGQVVQTVGCTLSIGISLLLPVYRSYAARDADTSKSLSKYLAGNPGHWDAYLKFLELEFCSESLLFWTEIQNLRTMNEHDAMRDKDKFMASVKYMYNNFIALTSPLPVNISSSSHDQIAQAIANWEAQQWATATIPDVIRVFEPAESEVYRIMNLGTFPRFMKWKAQKKGSSAHKDSSHPKDNSQPPQVEASSQFSISGSSPVGSPRYMPSHSSGIAGQGPTSMPKQLVEVVVTATDVDARNKVRESLDRPSYA